MVDLDAATGRGDNAEQIRAILAIPGLKVQVGGGVRTEERVTELLELGATRVVVGTRALEDPAWLGTVANLHPHRLVVAADVRERAVLTRGWDASLGEEIDVVLARLNALPSGCGAGDRGASRRTSRRDRPLADAGGRRRIAGARRWPPEASPRWRTSARWPSAASRER